MAEHFTEENESGKDDELLLTPDDKYRARQNLRSSSPVIFETIRQEGIEELQRPILSLWWSGIAAGLVMSLSLLCKGYLHAFLPDEPWRPLVSNFGYCIGFLLVIVGRLQLFTENTIKPVLPVLVNPRPGRFRLTGQLWFIVLVANLIGTFLSMLLVENAGVATPAQIEAFIEVSHHLAEREALTNVGMGVPAGFLLAALVWGMADNKDSRFWLIVAITYMIALGEMSHVVAGSAEVFLLALRGDMTFAAAFLQFVLPTLLGNVLGGTGLFALLAYGQVRHEIVPEED